MTRIVVTGAAGFIGSNLIKGLNARGIDNIIAVDDLTQGDKFRNLAALHIADYVDASVFYSQFEHGAFGPVEAVFHEGACSDTMEADGKYMMANNYTLSVGLFNACQKHGARLLYASSAATYGMATLARDRSGVPAAFRETPDHERPLNVYGYSKLLFDQRMRRECGADFSRIKPGTSGPTGAPGTRGKRGKLGKLGTGSQVVGFRYFNVYGPQEQHKGRMASVAFHQFHQFQATGKVKLFGEYGGYLAGAQMRDFVFVDDVVAVNLWFFDHPQHSGIFNLGTGRAQPFNDVALAVVNSVRAGTGATPVGLSEAVTSGLIEYVPFPDALVGKYQCYTQADLLALRAVGCEHVFSDVSAGVSIYMQWLQSHP